MAATLEIDAWDKPQGQPITDADLEGREWVMRYQVPYFGEAERRPISMKPDVDGLYYVDHGTPLKQGRASAAFYLNGEWLRMNKQPWKMKPTHWVKVPGLPVKPPSA
ncbi:MAG: hypothetical protein M3Q19_14520 [Pseudomonadota bacterium]|nr:hypothetical protein [Pseudomonadota bacterium]